MDDLIGLDKKISDLNIFILNHQALSLVGIIYYGMKKVFSDPTSYLKRCKSLGIDPKSCYAYCTDKEEIVYLISNYTKLGEMVDSTIHEILHFICGHIKRTSDKDPMIWNLACDHVVNREIESLRFAINLPKCSNEPFMIKELDTDGKSSAEEIYEKLINLRNKEKNKEDKDKTFSICPFGQSDNKKEDSNGDNKSDSSSDSQEGSNGDNKSDSSSGSSKSNNDKQNDKNQSKDDNKNESDDKVKSLDGNDIDLNNVEFYEVEYKGKKFVQVNDTDFVNKSNDPIEAEKKAESIKKELEMFFNQKMFEDSRGLLPAKFQQFLEKYLKPKIEWEKILTNLVLYPVQNVSKRTWNLPNFYIRKPRLQGKKLNTKSSFSLLCGLDSSASISTSQLEKFCGAICTVHKYFKKIIVLVHDVIVQDKIEIPNTNNLSEDYIFNLFKSRGIRGRGGTSHKDLFDNITSLIENDEKISSILFLTDFYSDIEAIYNKYKFMKEFETIWLITKDRYYSPEYKEVVLNGCKTKTINIPED